MRKRRGVPFSKINEHIAGCYVSHLRVLKNAAQVKSAPAMIANTQSSPVVSITAQTEFRKGKTIGWLPPAYIAGLEEFARSRQILWDRVCALMDGAKVQPRTAEKMVARLHMILPPAKEIYYLRWISISNMGKWSPILPPGKQMPGCNCQRCRSQAAAGRSSGGLPALLRPAEEQKKIAVAFVLRWRGRAKPLRFQPHV